MHDYDDQQPSEKDIVQPEDISNAPIEKCLENVGHEFENYTLTGFLFDKGENSSHMTEIVNSGYGSHTVQTNNVRNFGFIYSVQWSSTKFGALLSTVGPFEASECPEMPVLANRRGVVFHQNNARAYMSMVTCQELKNLCWEILMHPPYNPVD
ncbi:hypothetical protein TNCV_285921 [Trichonephila clavipes]|nr:hypothetical protein TNCV_285921 [Trichonephila clavipes]